MHTDDYLFHAEREDMITRSKRKIKKTKPSLAILDVSVLNTLGEGTGSLAASLPLLNVEMMNVSHDLLAPG